MTAPTTGTALDTSERMKAQNRADMEARYREHLRRGPDRCGCNMCRRARAALATDTTTEDS